jgi:hypothetical protein
MIMERWWPRDSSCGFKGLVWFTDGSRTADGTGAGVYGQSRDKRLRISLGKQATVFQAEVYEILARVYETETQDWPEKC